MDIYAVDPGPTESALVVYNAKLDRVMSSEMLPNDEMRAYLEDEAQTYTGDVLVIEQIVGYGMSIGNETIETAFWSGRFYEVWVQEHERVERMSRKDVKLELCGVAHAKSAEVRDAVLTLYGGREKAIGKKKSPGPLYGITNHKLAALALAIAFAQKEKLR